LVFFLIRPITSQVKECPFEALLPDGLPLSSVPSGHLNCADRRARFAEFVGLARAAVIAEVRSKRMTLLAT
jgi:hypothetical protein